MDRTRKRKAWRTSWKGFDAALEEAYSEAVWALVKRRARRARKIGFILGALAMLAIYCAVALSANSSLLSW